MTSLQNLKQLVKTLTIELIDCGGTTPEDTCELLAEEAPELYRAFGHEIVLAMCQDLQHSDVPTESALLQEMFHAFNTTYFAGQLPECEVHVVYDPNFWAGECSTIPVSGHVDADLRRIFIGLTSLPSMPHTLVHFMAHVATGTQDDLDERWINEMKLLEELGAPVLMPNPPAEVTT